MRYYSAAQLSDNIHVTPEGYLVCLGVPIARAGELVYGRGEVPITPGAGQTVVTRTIEDIHDPATMASFEGKPVTLHHPFGGDFVTPENWRKLAVGVVQHVRPGTGEDKDKLLADLLITDSAAIVAVQSKALREVSCGYDAEFEELAPGQGRQFNIVGNHVALVTEGRCGAACAIGDEANQQGGRGMKLKDKILALFGKAMDDAGIPDTEVNGDGQQQQQSQSGQAADAKVQDTEARDQVAALQQKVTDEVDGITKRLGVMEAGLAKLLGLDSLDALTQHTPAAVGDKASKPTEPDVCTDQDTIARAEILAPGIAKTKDVARKALAQAMVTDGIGAVVLPLLRGKAVDALSQDEVDGLLVSASEIVKVSRRSDMAKAVTIDNLPTIKAGPMTPEKVNELNAKQYASH